MEPSLSREIPGYHHLQRIRSQGDMSQMYRGTRMETDQEVIIKLVPTPKDEQEALKFQRRFNQEIRIAQLPAHAHLLTAIDHGGMPMPNSDEPRPYLDYPYIEHGSLTDLLTLEKPWETWELPHITDVIAQVAEGLFHLHKSDMVHQDVSPDRLLWTPTDSMRNPLRRIHVWLMNAGAAELEGNGETRDIKGTLSYLAPEQEKGEINASVDQYALALLARLLLTGQEPPLLTEPGSLVSPRPTQLNPQRLFEPDIDHVLFKGLARHPEARFTSVIEFAQALQTAILKQIQLQLYVPPSDSSLVLSQQHPATPTLPSNSSMGEEILILSSRPVRSKATIVLPPLNPPKPYEPPRPRDSSSSRMASRNNDGGLSFPILAAQKWLTVALPNALRMLAWSPSGTELVCTFYHDLPHVISVKHSVETLPGFAHAHTACWSPDGRLIALSMYDERNPQAEIRFYDRTTLKESNRALLLHQPEPIRGLDWSRRGLLAIWLKHKLLVYDLSNFSTRKYLPDPSYTLPLGDNMSCDQLTTLRWSPNGEWLAAGANNGQIVCWQPHTDRYFQQQPFNKKHIRSISWSPDGKMLVVAFANKHVLFWSLDTGETSQATLPENPRMVSISHQTGQIAIATEKTVFFFNHFDALAPTARLPGQRFSAFSSDNKLATLDQNNGNELIIWQL